MSWIVVGDSPRYEDCLVQTGFNTESEAKAFADKLNENPELQNKYGIKEHKNFRPKETKPSEEWWNDPFLAN